MVSCFIHVRYWKDIWGDDWVFWNNGYVAFTIYQALFLVLTHLILVTIQWAGTIIIPVLKRGKLRPRDIKNLSRSICFLNDFGLMIDFSPQHITRRVVKRFETRYIKHLAVILWYLIHCNYYVNIISTIARL